MLDLEDKVDNIDVEVKRADQNVQDMFKIYKNVQKNLQDKMNSLDGKVKGLEKNVQNIGPYINNNFVRKGIHNDVKSFIVKLKIYHNNRSKKKHHSISYLFSDTFDKFRFQQG